MKMLAEEKPRYRYVFAIILPIISTIVRLVFFSDLAMKVPYVTAYPAIVFSALYGGLRAGLLSTAISAFLVDYFWISPAMNFEMHGYADWLGMSIFIINSVLISWVIEKMHVALERAISAESEVKLFAERKQIHDELQASHERLALAQRAAKTGFWDWNMWAGKLTWSEEFYNLFGLPSTALPSFETWMSIIHPEDVELAKERIDRSIKERLPLDNEYRIIRPDNGQECWIAALGDTFYDEEGKPYRMCGICIDITQRKFTENALRENQERLNAALDAGEFGTWGLDIKTKKAWRSLRHDQIFGYKELLPEWTYEMFLGHVLPEDKESVDKKFGKAISKGTDWDFECRIKRTDGVIRWIWAQGKPILNNLHEVVSMSGFVKDITERKYIEEALRKSEARFAAFAAASFEGIVQSQAGRIVDCNPQFAQMAGRTVEELKNMSIADLIAPEDQERVMANIRSNSESMIEHAMLRKDGTRIIVEVRGQPMLLDNTLRQTVVRDISDRKHSEDELHKLNRTLRALSDSTQAMTRSENEPDYLKDVCRIVVKTCGHAMVWIGYKEENKAKTVKPMAQFGFDEGYLGSLNISWADVERGRGPTGTAIRTGTITMCRNMLTDPQFEPWRQEATKRGYASSIALPLIVDKKVLGALTIYSREPDSFSEDEIELLQELAIDLSHGITLLRARAQNIEVEKRLRRDKEVLEHLVEERSSELINAHMELERAKRLSDIGTLASTVAHELRNPLAAIAMAAHNVKRKAKMPEIEKHLDNIKKKVEESDQIINNLLFYSRLKPPHCEDVSIVEVLEECVELLEKKAQPKICVVRDLESVNGISIKADIVQLREVFNNILNNALDAVSSEKGEIKIIAEAKDEFIKIITKDNGSGIDKNIIDKIFDPFFTTKARGTGLGLAVCRQIINMHGGTIDIQSEPDKGTSVVITLLSKQASKNKQPLHES
ncbi:MAG: PAS domain-containing protein [Candidatus Omnitrophica bacterium]|nr:PAS domain-containing protein [Candidatus Omnitrophota bacterium]